VQCWGGSRLGAPSRCMGWLQPRACACVGGSAGERSPLGRSRAKGQGRASASIPFRTQWRQGSSRPRVTDRVMSELVAVETPAAGSVKWAEANGGS